MAIWETEMSDNEIKVSVSGSTVYRAVANYLKNSVDLKQHIKDAVTLAMASDALERSILHQVENEIRRYYDEKTLEKEISKVIRETAKEHIKKHLTKKEMLLMVQKSVSAMLVNEEK